MDTAIKKNDQDKIRSLIAEKSVAEIPSGKKVCVPVFEISIAQVLPTFFLRVSSNDSGGLFASISLN